jgi:hypothetical protein
MIEMKIRHGGKSYRGRTPESVARRVFGRRAHIKWGERIAFGPSPRQLAMIVIPPPARSREMASAVVADVIITWEES